MSVPISDYALLSNCRVSALVSRQGSIDWFCLPRPHSPSIFAAILDDRRGGRWQVRPAGARSVSRRYVGRSNVLETEFHCESGVLRLVDALHVTPDRERQRETLPDFELARRIECVEGEVEVIAEVEPRPDYGRGKPRLRDLGRFGFAAGAGEQSFVLRSDLPLSLDVGAGRLEGRQRLSAGDVRWMVLAHTTSGPEVAPMLGPAAQQRLQRTIDWWEMWVDGCNLPAVATDHVLRSAIALRSMVYPPSGAALAAPTTSLPEEIGGVRNWDYRYCWIRDAALIMRALLMLGARSEANAFEGWLLYATRLTWPKLSVLYDVHGLPAGKERELGHLAGYCDSRPVRIGNGARNQLQLDTYGALLDAAWQYHQRGGALSHRAGRMLRGFVRTAARLWSEPDAGIWELRSGPAHHTLSKAMCWVAMERGLRLAEAGIMSVDTQRLRGEMDRVRRAVEDEGFNGSLGAYTSEFGGDAMDASLLLLSIYGFEPADSPRMLGTIERIYEKLGSGAVLHRYRAIDDGLPGGEGGFGICSFWGVEAQAMAGRTAEARAAMDELLGLSNDVLLYAEEFGDAGEALGNFPQALTHIGLINAACALDPERAATREAAAGGAV